MSFVSCFYGTKLSVCYIKLFYVIGELINGISRYGLVDSGQENSGGLRGPGLVTIVRYRRIVIGYSKQLKAEI